MLIHVAVPVPALGLLTYRVADEGPAPVVGARVAVPLGSRVVTGVVVDIAAQAVDGVDVKSVRSVLDAAAYIPQDVVDLAQWTAGYYAAGPGEALIAVLPPKARSGQRGYKTQRAFALTNAGRDIPRESLTAARRRALDVLTSAAGPLPASELKSRGVAAGVLRALERAGLVEVTNERIERDPFAASALETPTDSDRVLTTEQAVALERLIALHRTGTFRAALLRGVTGSGKTEVYLRLADTVHAAGKSVLMLVPEIALTPAVASAFRQAFGQRVAIQHSGLSDGERHDQWQRIRRREVDVVIGTRSAVFAPLDRVGLIVVDEEHDGSYKQEESPRYHARDVAVVRAHRAGALIVLGSATPSMETYRHALAGRYEHIVLDRRVLDRPLAAVSVVDMRTEFAESGPDVVLSRALSAALADRLDRREQALVLLNRRGFSTAVFCRQCGSTLECPNCSVSLVVHGKDRSRRARCHYCNHSMAVPGTCPTCAGPYLEHMGYGTERVEAEVSRCCPGARVARLDRDSTRRRGALTSVLERFRSGEIDVLVGTQMIAKGHDFPRVTLVGVVSADVGLGMADFRAAERTFQLLTQVAGRAGRGAQPGEAIVQTLYPEHYSVQLACQQDYASFAERELAFRKAMRYPPFVALINVVVRGRTPGQAMEDAGRLAEGIHRRSKVALHVLGPAPAPLARVRGEYRAQILIKGTDRRGLRESVQTALATESALARRVTIDVDPLSVL